MKSTLFATLTFLSLITIQTSTAQTLITSCNNEFTDTQGTDNYLNNDNSEWLICPDTLTEYLTIEFTHVDIEVSEGPGIDSTGCNDILYIYDGMDDLSPLVGSFCGQESTDANQPMIAGNELKVGDQFKPTNESGCFFVRFVSDAKDNRSGWTADISCCVPSLDGGVTDGINTPIAENAGADINLEMDNNCIRKGRLGDFTDFMPVGSECFSAGLTEPHQSFYAFESNDLGGFAMLTVEPVDSVANIQMLVFGPVTIDSTGTHYDGGVINWCVTGENPEPLFFNAGPSQTFILAVATELPGRTIIGTSYESVSLPIEMTEYKLTQSGKNVTLDWETSLETNNDGFEIYRSSNGRDFTMIGFEKSKGTSNTSTAYRFVDQPNVDGRVYYYISHLDLNGHRVDYDILSAKFENDKISAYPNPSSGPVTINIPFGNDSAISINVFDQIGKKVIETSTNDNTYLLDLPRGVYTIHVSTGVDTQVIKQIISH